MKPPRNIWVKYGYVWVTLILFIGSLAGHWTFAWFEYVDEQRTHGENARFDGYFVQTARDTLENWQSEFLQLIWQVGGLAFLLYVGSPQSKDGDERLEEKVDALLELLGKEQGREIIAALDARFPKK